MRGTRILTLVIIFAFSGKVALCRDFFAVVGQDGKLIRGDAGTVSALRYGQGRYEVSFNSAVTACGYTATIGDPGNALVFNPGLVFTAGGHNSANGVYVETKNLGGGLTDFPFHLSVNCTSDYAVVNATGGLVRGDARSVARLGVGRFEVTFAGPVSNCSYTATIGDPGNALVFNPGLVFTAGGHNSGNGVYVETKNLGGGLTDFPFHVSANCTSDFAVVNATGGLVRGDAKSAARLGVGRFEVAFAGPVSNCSYTATIGDPGNALVFNPGLVFTAGGHNSGNGVYVETKNLGGGLTDFPFHLRCNCATSPTVITEFLPDTGRGGRTVNISMQAGTMMAIAATESGGLFQTGDGGQSWSHIDSFPAFRMSDVAFVGGLQFPDLVIATATDADPDPQTNQGGVWTSNDSGASWTHVALPCPNATLNGYGIGFAMVPGSPVESISVYVATDCGLFKASSPSWTWARSFPTDLMSVSVTGASANIVDLCLAGGGHSRSVDSGTTWSPVHPGPECGSSRSIAVSPHDSSVLFATSHAIDPGGGGTLESDDNGVTWVPLKSGSYSGRPLYIATHNSMDQNPGHFDVYFPGQQVTCSDTPIATTSPKHCPTDPNKWNSLPASSLNHDINGVGLDPGSSNCAVYEVADFGVYRMGNPSPGLPCGDPATWTIAGNSAAGFNALQMYQIAGHVQFSTIGNVSGHTNLFSGTMDNGVWATYDAGASKWLWFGEPEGSFLQASQQQSLAPTLVTFDSIDIGLMKEASLDQVSGLLSSETNWTAANPPGDSSPPFLVADSTYVQWSGATLYLTTNSGQSWVPVGTLPSNLSPFNAIQVASTPSGPAIFEAVGEFGRALGVALLQNFLPLPSQPIPFVVQTLSGTNPKTGAPTGLQAIWGNCFGQGAWYCAAVFAADPNDYHHLYAIDSVQRLVVSSTDAGVTWKPETVLTNLITAGRPSSLVDSIGNSQVHVFALDPGNSSHILVGTDSAGIFASANGGQTWSPLPNTTRARAITSFFFDDRTSTIFVGTYGRGLWKLMVDWASLH
jgi:hypothetical protein